MPAALCPCRFRDRALTPLMTGVGGLDQRAASGLQGSPESEIATKGQTSTIQNGRNPIYVAKSSQDNKKETDDSKYYQKPK
jgi:hypothetical protein